VTDDERLLQIRRAHASARPSDVNPAWKNSHHDLAFVLGYLDTVLAVSPASVPDTLLVDLFYAAQGDISKFRIKARALLQTKTDSR
jgi:hypothetical protein